MKRRGFLKLLLALFGSTTIVSLSYPLMRFLAPPPAERAKGKQIIIKRAEILLGETKNIVMDNTPLIVISRQEKGLIALSRVCTHLGCLVEYDKAGRRLLCPCHAGAFDLEGNVISGPPPKPLSRVPLKVEGENIIIG